MCAMTPKLPLTQILRVWATSPNAEDESLFTVKTLAKYLQVSQQWVYERVQHKEILHIKLGKFPRFKKSDINPWLETPKIPASEPLSRPLTVERPRKGRGPTE
jgi:excisionase family DNA binding protein